MRYFVPAFAVAAGLAGTQSLGAQCIVDTSSNEAKLLTYYSAPPAFSASWALGVKRLGAI